MFSCRAVRQTCHRCFRPIAFCYCKALPAIAARTRVVILQHPREERRAICSARMAWLSLQGAELLQGVDFDDHPRIQALAADSGAVLLFPGDGAVPVETLAGRPPATLVAVDGTWHQAPKMVRSSRILSALPRVAIDPREPSSYGELRREPAPHCLSTIEAIALALGTFERDPDRFTPMRELFRRVVDQQLGCAVSSRRIRSRSGGARPGGDPGPAPESA